MDHVSVKAELRAMTRTDEVLLPGVKRVRATEVRAGDREHAENPTLAGEESSERWITRRVGLPAVCHHECHALRSGKLRDLAFLHIRNGPVEKDREPSLCSHRATGREKIFAHRGGDGSHGRRQHTANPPAEKRTSRDRAFARG